MLKEKKTSIKPSSSDELISSREMLWGCSEEEKRKTPKVAQF